MKALTYKELAEALGSNVGSVYRWVQRGMPRDAAGARAWRAEYAQQKVKPHAPVDGSGESFSHWRTRQARALALKAENELAEQAGQLIRYEDFRVYLESSYAAAKACALSLPKKLAPRVAHETDVGAVARILENEMHDFLTHLSGGLQELKRREPKGEA